MRTRFACVGIAVVALIMTTCAFTSVGQASLITAVSEANAPNFTVFGNPAESNSLTPTNQPQIETNQYTSPLGIGAGESPAFSASGTAGSVSLPPSGSATYLFSNGTTGVAQTYAFAVTVNNASALDIHRLGFQLSNVNMSTAQFNQLALSLNQLSPARFDNGSGGLVHGAVIPVAPLYVINADEILFDPNLAAGNKATYEFSLAVPAGLTGRFDFTVFAAAPEPTSLVLGAIGLVATGGFGFMRRRKQEVAPVAV